MDSVRINQVLVERVTKENFADFNRIRELVGASAKTWDQFERDKWNSWLIKKVGRTDRPVGMINIVPFQDKEQEIGFVLVPDKRGKGLLGSILGPFVATLSTPLYSETSEGNASAMRVLEKAGFHRCDPVHKTHVDPTGEEVVTAAFRFSTPS